MTDLVAAQLEGVLYKLSKEGGAKGIVGSLFEVRRSVNEALKAIGLIREEFPISEPMVNKLEVRFLNKREAINFLASEGVSLINGIEIHLMHGERDDFDVRLQAFIADVMDLTLAPETTEIREFVKAMRPSQGENAPEEAYMVGANIDEANEHLYKAKQYCQKIIELL